jgi:hypothetical protein
MVQIIPRVESSSDRFAKAFGNLAGNLSQAIPQELMGRAERQQLGSLLGQDISDIRNPDFLKLILQNKMRQEASDTEHTANIETQQKTIAMMNKYFGPEAAEIYPYLTEGGKTALFQSLILGKERGQNISDVLTKYFSEYPEEVEHIAETVSEQQGMGAQQMGMEGIPQEPPSPPKMKSVPENRGISFKGEEEIAKKEVEASEKYLGEIREKYNRARTLEPVFEELKDTVRAGGTDAFSAGNLADIGQKMGGFLGTTFNAIGKALESGETGKFRALSKKLLDEMKDIFGGQIRVKELEVFLSMLPEIGKSKEANLAAIDVLQRLSTASTMFYDTAQEIIQNNGGKIPRNLADQVQNQLRPVISDLAKDITKTTTKFGKENKKLTQNIASQILKEAKGDKELARRIAKQRGYKF